jgi:hypothetical protein
MLVLQSSDEDILHHFLDKHNATSDVNPPHPTPPVPWQAILVKSNKCDGSTASNHFKFNFYILIILVLTAISLSTEANSSVYI